MGDGGSPLVADISSASLEQLKSYRERLCNQFDRESRAAMDAASSCQNYRLVHRSPGRSPSASIWSNSTSRARSMNSDVCSGARSVSRPSRWAVVIDRFRKEELHAAEQREQREGDDAAMRISLTHTEASNPLDVRVREVSHYRAQVWASLAGQHVRATVTRTKRSR